MQMSEKAVLRDCLESLKHASVGYLQASFECDSDPLRQICQGLAVDHAQARNAVFNLMHQAGMYRTTPADHAQVQRIRETCETALRHAHGPQMPVTRELHGAPDPYRL